MYQKITHRHAYPLAVTITVFIYSSSAHQPFCDGLFPKDLPLKNTVPEQLHHKPAQSRDRVQTVGSKRKSVREEKYYEQRKRREARPEGCSTFKRWRNGDVAYCQRPRPVAPSMFVYMAYNRQTLGTS